MNKLYPRAAVGIATAALAGLSIAPAMAITFQPPDELSPGASTGGASRGIIFEPPDDLSPGATTGGASRDTQFEPPDSLSPSRTAGGASRESNYCFSSGDAPMSAIVPGINNGYTTAERPTFLAYIPETRAEEAFFSVQDDDGNQHYQAVVSLPETPGVVSFSMPEEAPALEVGQTYHWFVVALCNQKLEPDSPLAIGSVQRTDRAAAPAGTTLEEVEALAEAGIWYDTVAALARLRQSQPEDTAVSAAWQELLSSVELDAIAAAPLAR